MDVYRRMFLIAVSSSAGLASGALAHALSGALVAAGVALVVTALSSLAARGLYS